MCVPDNLPAANVMGPIKDKQPVQRYGIWLQLSLYLPQNNNKKRTLSTFRLDVHGC